MKYLTSILLIFCITFLPSCSHSTGDSKQSIAYEDEHPSLANSDADRTPKFLLAITSDSLLTCYNNFSGNDEDPLILDTTNPGLTDFMAQWINSMDSAQINELKNTSTLHITVGTGVSDDTLDKVKMAVKTCGIEKFSISNFDIESNL